MFLILGKIFLYLFIALIVIIVLLAILAWFLEMKDSYNPPKEAIKRNSRYIVAFERIKYETNTQECISCEQNFDYKLHDMYQEYGNCGGLSGELFVDCNYCGCKNEVYKCI